MLSGCWSMLPTYLLFANLLFGAGVWAKEGSKVATKIGNSTIERTVQLRTHSLYPPYIDQDLQNRWWDFGADAYVNTNKHIRLTQHKPSQVGWLWSRLALTATNWVIEAEFKIGGETSHLYGDGMAMWITTERAQTGPIFGNKDYFNGLVIALDTYSNEKHTYGFPRILGVRLDGKTKYDYHNDADKQALGACSANFRRTNVATKLKVTYVKDEFLDVKIQYKAWDEWTDCFTIPKLSLPTNPFVGFSAMTGDVSDAHDIISVTTYSAILSPPDTQRDTIKANKKWSLPGKKTNDPSRKSGSWLGFFFKVFLFGGIAAGAWYAYKEYQRRQRFSGGFGGMGSAGFKSPSSARSYGPPSAGLSSAGPYTPAGSALPFGNAYTPTTAGFGGPSSPYGAPPQFRV
ncbi:lectin [Coprinopsis cinerea AmutBmut pab1-1]|nr:lectin [Coprinopsis cinerea AmutBmut pab1-1]